MSDAPRPWKEILDSVLWPDDPEYSEMKAAIERELAHWRTECEMAQAYATAAQAKIERIELAGKELPEEPIGKNDYTTNYAYMADLRDFATAQKVRADRSQVQRNADSNDSCLLCGKVAKAAVWNANFPAAYVCHQCRDHALRAAENERDAIKVTDAMVKAFKVKFHSFTAGEVDYDEAIKQAIDAAIKEQT